MLQIIHCPSTHSILNPPDISTLQASRAIIEKNAYPRKALKEILLDYNKGIGNDSIALEAVSGLESEKSVCIVTGQQLGLMGGPSYTILKALSTLLLARDLGAIPLFWLATEDHDLEEISSTYLIDTKGNLQRFRLRLPKEKLFVEDLVFSASNSEIIRLFLQAIGQPNLLADWKVEMGMSYASAMANLLARLFRGTGLAFVEPRLLRPLAKSFFKKEVAFSAEIVQLLKRSQAALEASGKKASISIEKGTQIFFKSAQGIRTRIFEEEGYYRIGESIYTGKDLIAMIEEQPFNFSTNVLSRPVLQSLLIPTLAYVGGPTELAYYQQLAEYHAFHGATFPLLVPRLSVTVISPEAKKFLEQCQIQPWDEVPARWADWCLLKEKPLPIAPAHALHYLRNVLKPHQKPQERVLNWWEFQRWTSQNLIQELLQRLSWKDTGHHYVYLKEDSHGTRS